MTRLAIITSLLMLFAVADTPTDIVIHAKFDTATEHVLIPVTMGDHEFWCSPDSGFSALIALDHAKAVAAGLSVAPGIPTPDGNPPPPGDRSTTTTVVVGGVAFPNHSIILRQFPEEAPDMDCVMGVALLRRFVVEFDYVTPRLILSERSAYRPPSGAATVPLLFRTNPSVPYMDIQMTLSDGSNTPLRVLPDTGTSYYGAVLVGSAEARAESQLRTAPAVIYGDARITQLLAARPRAITLGPFTVNEPVIALVQGGLGGGGAIADGTLGSGFVRKFTVAFDFEGRVMYLKPNERLSQPHAFDASGVGFIRRGGRHVVYAVIQDSAAAQAGVRVGDVLLQVDDRAADALTPLELRALFSADEGARRLVLEREGRPLTLVVPLKQRI